MLEEGVSDDQAVSCAQVQQALAIVAHRAWQAKLANAATPLFCMLPHFGVEIAQKHETVGGRDVLQGWLKLLVGLLLSCFISN